MLKVFMPNSEILDNCACWINNISRALMVCNDREIWGISLEPPVVCRTQQPNPSGKESDDCKMNRTFCKSVRIMAVIATQGRTPYQKKR